MFLEWENKSGKLQIISGKFQNNAINDVKQISLSHAISVLIPMFKMPVTRNGQTRGFTLVTALDHVSNF